MVPEAEEEESSREGSLLKSISGSATSLSRSEFLDWNFGRRFNEVESPDG
jgi:hypothetical protein